MTEVCGLIGNWLTWPCYTWSHNVSHPSCVEELGTFFNNEQQQKKKKRFILVPLCGGSCVDEAMLPPTHPSQHFKEWAGWGWSLHDGCSFPPAASAGERAAPPYLTFHEPSPLQGLRKHSHIKKTSHWCRGSGERSAPSFLTQDGRLVSFSESERDDFRHLTGEPTHSDPTLPSVSKNLPVSAAC